MHVRDLLELAALVASHASTSLADTAPIPASSLETYWTASRARLDRWGHGIKRFSNQATKASTPRSREINWLTTRPILEEIFLGEVLARVWTAILVADDRRRGVQESEPVGRSVLVGHLEARHRAMNLLVHDAAVEPGQAVSLNRICRRAERWTDLLIGRLMRVTELSEFAFNPQRAREFCSDLRQQEHTGDQNIGWAAIHSALRGTFAEGLDQTTANPDLNAAIANGILAWWSPAQFDGTGLLRSSWVARMSTATDDTQQLIEQLFLTEKRDADAHPPLDRAGYRHVGDQDRFRG